MYLCFLQIEKHVKQGITRVCVSDSAPPRKMAGVIDILGARVTPDGKIPVLETRHRFYCPKQMTKVSAACRWLTWGDRALQSVGVGYVIVYAACVWCAHLQLWPTTNGMNCWLTFESLSLPV
jgi:hypothetical protein